MLSDGAKFYAVICLNLFTPELGAVGVLLLKTRKMSHGEMKVALQSQLVIQPEVKPKKKGGKN